MPSPVPSGLPEFINRLDALLGQTKRAVGTGLSSIKKAADPYLEQWAQAHKSGDINLPAPARDLNLAAKEKMFQEIDSGRRDMIAGKRIVNPGNNAIDTSEFTDALSQLPSYGEFTKLNPAPRYTFERMRSAGVNIPTPGAPNFRERLAEYRGLLEKFDQEFDEQMSRYKNQHSNYWNNVRARDRLSDLRFDEAGNPNSTVLRAPANPNSLPDAVDEQHLVRRKLADYIYELLGQLSPGYRGPAAGSIEQESQVQPNSYRRQP